MSMHPQAIPMTLPDRFIARTRSWREGLRRRQASSDRFAGELPCQLALTAPTSTPFGPLAQAGAHATFACIGCGAGILHVAGQWRGLISFVISDDGITWKPATLTAFVTGEAETEATKPGMWRTPPDFAGRFLRVQVCALASGTVSGAFAAAAWPETYGIPLPHAA